MVWNGMSDRGNAGEPNTKLPKKLNFLLVPWKLRLKCDDIGRRHARELRVAAVDGASHPAHDGGNGLTRSELAIGIGFDHSHALDAGNLSDLAPKALSHVGFRVVDECFHSILLIW
jgi:hypothetical protein